MFAGGRLGGRRDDGLGKLPVLDQPVREAVAVQHPLARGVHPPDAGLGAAGDVVAHHHLHRQHVEPPGHHHVGIGIVDHVVGADVGGGVEPEPRRLGQHLALVGHGGEHQIERRLAVGGDHDAPPVGQIVGIAHLALLEVRERGEAGVGQAAVQLPLDIVGGRGGHFVV